MLTLHSVRAWPIWPERSTHNPLALAYNWSVDHIGYSRGIWPKRSDHGFQSCGSPSTSEGESGEEQEKRMRRLTWVHSEELFFDQLSRVCCCRSWRIPELSNLGRYMSYLVTLGARAPGNRWEHLRNMVGTGTLCLWCNHQTHVKDICNVPCTCNLHVPTNHRLITFQMYFPFLLRLSHTNQSVHFDPSLTIPTVYPCVTCRLHYAGTSGMYLDCKCCTCFNISCLTHIDHIANVRRRCDWSVPSH